MTTDIFHVREQALEYEFFHKVDEELWDQLRRQMAFDEQRQALADATGITDETVLAELVELNINSKTIYALSLFPLVWLAWGDGQIEPGERQVVLDAARAAGHEPDSASLRLLESWLEHEPPQELAHVWKDYVHALRQAISPVAFLAVRSDILTRARRLVNEFNVRYGFHDKEAARDAVLAEIEKTFKSA